LSIRIKYSDEKAKAAIVSDILGFPYVDVTPVTDNPARHTRKVRAVPNDTVYLYNDKSFTVIESDGRRVHATCDDGDHVNIDNEFLWNFILEG